MIPHNADDALRLWLHVEAGGDQLRSLSLLDSEEVCSRPTRTGVCGGKKSSKGKLGRETWICASCGQPWRGVVVPILAPRQRRSRGSEIRVRGKLPRVKRYDLVPLERAADVRRALAPVFETRPRDLSRADWTFLLLALALSIDGHGRSYVRTAELGLERYPQAATPRRWWSEWKVREACGDARTIIERRLWAARRGGRWNDGWESARQQSGSASALGTSAA